MDTKDLTLWHIDTELAQLYEYRDERLSDREDPPSSEEIEALRGEIQKYLEALPRKVSGVAAIVRKWRSQRTAITAEIERLRGIERQLEEREESLKAYCDPILERQPMPAKGSRKLVGADGSVISLRGNGGLQPLQVDGWDPDTRTWAGESVLPDYLRIATVKMPVNIFQEVSRQYPAPMMAMVCSEPNNAAIREELAAGCPECGYNSDPCPACDGTGFQIIPGARLLPRGSHVEIK